MPATIEHFKGNRSPSKTDTIKVNNLPFDLTGSSVKWRSRAEDGTALVIDEAAVVLTPAAGTVRYDPSAAFAALPAGDYPSWWSVTLPSGFTQDTIEFLLTIIDHAPSFSRALCELEDVTAFAPGYTSDSETDAVLLDLIDSRSRDWYQMTGREFKAISPASNPRRFDVGMWTVNERQLRIGDLATVNSMKLYDFDQTTLVQTISATDYVLWPRVRQEWEPVRKIMLPAFTPNATFPLVGQVFEIDGVWGFPSLPQDVRSAVAGMVLFDYVTRVEERGTLFAAALADVNVGRLFARGREVMESYGRPPLA